MSPQTASATQLYPDDELIGLCHECDALYLRFLATFRDEFTLQPDVALQEKQNLITMLQRNLLDQICAIHATTLKGLRARDRVNVLDTLLDQHWTERLREALHRDLAGHAENASVRFELSISIPALPEACEPVLRDDESRYDAAEDSSDGDTSDGILRPARAIIAGFVLAVPSWALLAMVAYVLIHALAQAATLLHGSPPPRLE